MRKRGSGYKDIYASDEYWIGVLFDIEKMGFWIALMGLSFGVWGGDEMWIVSVRAKGHFFFVFWRKGKERKGKERKRVYK